jgi:hypothetical protein
MIKMQGRPQIITGDELLKAAREGVVRYVSGKPVENNESTFWFKANVQPVQGFDLLIVPEGERTRENFWLFIMDDTIYDENGLETEVSEEGSTLRLNDRIERTGIQYQVQKVEDWGSYTRARIARIDTGKRAKGQQQ